MKQTSKITVQPHLNSVSELKYSSSIPRSAVHELATHLPLPAQHPKNIQLQLLSVNRGAMETVNTSHPQTNNAYQMGSQRL